METKRNTAYLCFPYSVNGEIQSRNRRRKLSFTSLIEACFKFKFKYPSSLNPRFTTILHLCAIEVGLKLSTKLYGITSGSHITSILPNSTIPDNKWSKFSFFRFKDVEKNITLSCHFKMDARKWRLHGNRWSNPPPHLVSSSLRAALWGENYFQQIFSTTVSTHFFFFLTRLGKKPVFFSFDGGWKMKRKR